MQTANMDIPIDKMHSVITDFATRREPVSIVRYGDGEAIVLNGFNDMDAIKMVMKRQFGRIPSIEDIEQIIDNLKTSYTGADIIGIPGLVRFRDKRNYWSRAFDILSNAISHDVLKSKQLTDIDFHSHMLDNRQFDPLLQDREVLCYVSCRNLDEAFRRRYNIRKVYSYIIAPEAKFTPGYRGKQHFPDQFKEIKKWMTKIPVQGNLCLVGAGFTGKIYNNWFRDLGGVAVDLGCVFDFWYGKVTRGEKRGAESYDNKYKL